MLHGGKVVLAHPYALCEIRLRYVKAAQLADPAPDSLPINFIFLVLTVRFFP